MVTRFATLRRSLTVFIVTLVLSGATIGGAGAQEQLAVVLDARHTVTPDAEGPQLRYEWDFDADGTVDGAEHVYDWEFTTTYDDGDGVPVVIKIAGPAKP